MKKELNEESKPSKEFKKKGLTIALVGVACAIFAGCDTLNFLNGSSSSSSLVDTSSSESSRSDDSLDSPFDGEVDSSEPLESASETSSSDSAEEPPIKESDPIPYEEIAAFVNRVDTQGYCFNSPSLGADNYYNVDGDKMYVTSNSSEIGTYYYIEENKHYKLVYDTATYKWNKYDDKEAVGFDSLIYDTLVGTEWTFYDEDTRTVTGVYNGLTYSFNLEEYLFQGDVEGEIMYLGNTRVSLPSSNNIIDKTEASLIDNSPEICTINNGRYTFNIKEMQDALLAWTKGKNQYNSDIIAKKWDYKDAKTLEIPYVNANKDVLEFGVIYSRENKKYYAKVKFKDSNLYSKIQNAQIKTKNEFVNYLDAADVGTFKFDVNSIELDTEISKSNFNTLTDRVFWRMQYTGSQGDSINNDYPETRIDDFSEAKVLYGFKTKSGGEVAAYDLGLNKNWKQYYIINFEGKIELVKFSVTSASANGVADELENVIENNRKKWMINSIEREVINLENYSLYK